jgi:sigma-B regulation protein RsbU (phosphoserine phosphatase)
MLYLGSLKEEMKKQLQLILGATFFALLLIYSGIHLSRTIALLGMDSEPGWYPYQAGDRIVITQLATDPQASLLKPGDEIIAINGQRLEQALDYTEIFQNVKPGTPYSLLVRRNGQFAEFSLQTRAIPIISWILIGARNLLMPCIFLLTGVAVFLLKPYDKQAFLLALMFGMFISALQATVPPFGDSKWWIVGVMLLVQIASTFFWPIFFHFFLIFPEPSPLLRRFPRLEYYLYIPHLLTIFPYFALANIWSAFAIQRDPPFGEAFLKLGPISLILSVVYITAGLLSLLVNYRQAGLVSRRKMRVIVAGSIAGFLPIFLVFLLAITFELPRSNPELLRWIAAIAFLAFPVFPLSFAYAIIRHQVIPVRLIVRRSARYLLVSRGFIIIQAFIVFAALSFMLTGSRMEAIDRLGPRADIVATMVVTAIAIGVLTLVNQQMLPIIDRWFFREAYDAQRLLSDLGQEMRTVTTVSQLLERSVARIQDALYTENVTIFLRDQASGNYRAAISSKLTEDGTTTSDIDRAIAFPKDGAVVDRLRKSTQPVIIDFENSWMFPPDSRPIESTGELSEGDERRILRRIRSALLLPVSTQEQLLGIISLGHRLGDLPYSWDDKNLLMTVSLQMAFAIQNADLVKQITEEELLRHELEIATTVQRRLFPEEPPEVKRLDLCGVCHPARGVGGDYYDFILLDQSRVGIAVADVAGKGISAALLMSIVQASLRSQAPSVNGRLTDLVSSMNRLLHVSTDAASYATFFYAQFSEDTGLLTYVNAGHNPPILIRAGGPKKALIAGQAIAATGEVAVAAIDSGFDSGGVSLLTTGGPVIGAFNTCVYEQESIKMDSGDLLVAYTDGVTEALNCDDQEFGELKLRGIIAESAHLSASELTEKIVECVRQWCGETAQHDDLTLVVMKVR